jgi:hypothetical protein
MSDFDTVERCSEGLILRHSCTHKIYILKDILIADKNRHDVKVRNLMQQRTTHFNHLLNLIGFERHASRDICSSTYRISTVL